MLNFIHSNYRKKEKKESGNISYVMYFPSVLKLRPHSIIIIIIYFAQANQVCLLLRPEFVKFRFYHLYYYALAPPGQGALSDDARLFVCLSRTSGLSREQRGQED